MRNPIERINSLAGYINTEKTLFCLNAKTENSIEEYIEGRICGLNFYNNTVLFLPNYHNSVYAAEWICVKRIFKNIDNVDKEY